MDWTSKKYLPIDSCDHLYYQTRDVDLKWSNKLCALSPCNCHYYFGRMKLTFLTVSVENKITLLRTENIDTSFV